MTYTTIVKREELEGLFDLAKLTETAFLVTISPISEEEADELEFKSLKGIAGKWLDRDEIRRERLNI